LDQIKATMEERRELIRGHKPEPAREGDASLGPIGCGNAESPIFCIPGSEPAPLPDGLCMSRTRRYFASALLAVLVLTISLGCGRKGPPQVPKARGPVPVMDLKAVARGGAVTLHFTLPSKNIDGTPFRGLTRIDVYRRARMEAQDGLDTSMLDKLFGRKGNKAKLLFTIKEDELHEGKNLLGREVHLVDDGKGLAPENWFANVFDYFVFTHGGRWRKSPPSNLARAMPLLGPKLPEKVTKQSGDSVVKIAWQPQTLLANGSPIKGEVFYNVYRVPNGGWPLEDPLNEKLLLACSYLDHDVKNDSEYRYTVTTVIAHGELFAESATSATVCATPVDRIAPPAPGGLEAVAGQGSVNLLWKETKAPDLLGYRVYRRRAGEGTFMLLTPEPILRTLFLDRTVFPNVEYAYCVTTVDNSSSRNESGASNVVVARPR